MRCTARANKEMVGCRLPLMPGIAFSIRVALDHFPLSQKGVSHAGGPPHASLPGRQRNGGGVLRLWRHLHLWVLEAPLGNTRRAPEWLQQVSARAGGGLAITATEAPRAAALGAAGPQLRCPPTQRCSALTL